MERPRARLVRAHGDPSIEAAYYPPLLTFLDAQRGGGPIRVEVPFTANHWEAAHVAPHYPLARGWERQLDQKANALFYDRPRWTRPRYRRWLDDNAVRCVALSDAPLDYSAEQEARSCARRGCPGFTAVSRSAHWRVYAVERPAAARRRRRDRRRGWAPTRSISSRAHRATSHLRVRFTPYWAVVAGRLRRERRRRLDAAATCAAPGTLRIATRFSLRRDRVARAPLYGLSPSIAR